MEPFLFALIAQGLIGGADVIVNHKVIAQVPARDNAGPEEVLHSARECIFGTLFFALAWFEWHGVAVLFIAGLLLAEVVVSTVDTVLEFDTRLLPVTERVAHVFLFVNLGILVTLVGQALLAWGDRPSAIVGVDYGAVSWLLSGLAVLALGWSVRDGLNALKRMRPVTAG